MTHHPDLIALSATPLQLANAIAHVTDPAAGGIALFLGTTRSEITDAGKSLLALDYDAYSEMARKQLADLAQTARQRWPICRLAILHRTGRVPVGQPSVLIAVSTPHRAEAFQACHTSRHIMRMIGSADAAWRKYLYFESENLESETAA